MKKRRKKKVVRTAKAKPKRPRNIGANTVVVRSTVHSSASVKGRARVKRSHILDRAVVGDNAEVIDSYVTCRAKVVGNSELAGSEVVDRAEVRGGTIRNCFVFADAIIGDSDSFTPDLRNASIGKHACVIRTTDYLVIGPIGTRQDYLTAYRTAVGRKRDIGVHTGCFTGTIDEFVKRVKEQGTEGDPSYLAAVSLIRSYARAHDWYRS